MSRPPPPEPVSEDREALAEKPAGHYDNPTLVGMSYSDAGAVQELGERLSEVDPETARDMMLRAVALDPENTKPLLWLTANNYSAIANNGEPALNEMQESYVLWVVAEGMGGYGNPEFSARRLRELGFTEQDFADLDAIANEELQKVRGIRLDVAVKKLSSVAATLIPLAGKCLVSHLDDINAGRFRFSAIKFFKL